MAFQKGVAQTIQIICYDSETPTDPTSPVVTVAKDTGSFTAATNSPTVVTPGRVVITLTATEMNADAIAVKVSSDNLEDQIALFYTEADYTATRAGRIDKLNVSGTLANTDNANQFKADVSGVAPAGEYDAAMAKLDVAVSTRSTFDPATDTVKAKDHLGNPFAAEADIRDAIIEADLSDYEDTAATGTTLGEFMVASRAGIVGRMKIEGTTITFYQTDGTTPIFTATLNDADVPTERGTPTDPA